MNIHSSIGAVEPSLSFPLMEHEPEGTQNALVEAAMWNIRIDAATGELIGRSALPGSARSF